MPPITDYRAVTDGAVNDAFDAALARGDWPTDTDWDGPARHDWPTDAEMTAMGAHEPAYIHGFPRLTDGELDILAELNADAEDVETEWRTSLRDTLREAVEAIESGRCEADSPYLTLAVKLIEDVVAAL